MNSVEDAHESLKRALAASEEERATNKRQLTELRAAYVELATSHAVTKEALRTALHTEASDALVGAVHDMVMSQTPAVLMHMVFGETFVVELNAGSHLQHCVGNGERLVRTHRRRGRSIAATTLAMLRPTSGGMRNMKECMPLSVGFIASQKL